MIEKKFVALIHQEIDAMNSADETAKLRAYLAQNVEARKLYDELVAATSLLKEIKAVEPSPNLKKRIMGAIQTDRYAVRAKKSARSGVRNFVDMLFGAPSYQLKYAYAFAFGMMAGLFIYALLSNTSQQQAGVDHSNLYGTIAWRDAAGDFEAVDSMAVNLDVGRASMRVTSSPQQVVAELRLNTTKEVKIHLAFEENDLGFNGVSQANSQAGTAFNSNEHTLKFVNRGENRYVIAFANKTQAASLLRFSLFASDALQYATTLATAKGNHE